MPRTSLTMRTTGGNTYNRMHADDVKNTRVNARQCIQTFPPREGGFPRKALISHPKMHCNAPCLTELQKAHQMLTPWQRLL